MREEILAEIKEKIMKFGCVWIPVGEWDTQLSPDLTRKRIYNAARSLGMRGHTTAGPLFVMGWVE